MAEAVVAIVVEGIKPLGELILQQGKFLSGVGNQIELAQSELHMIRGFLKDANARQGDEQLVRNCVELIRDAAYDLEDVIESFALKVTLRRRGGSSVKIVIQRFARIFKGGVHRYRIGSDIEDIRAKISHLTDLRSRLQSYNIRQTSGGEGEGVTSAIKRQRDRRLTYGHEVESHVVGLKESTDVLVKELVREGNRHRALSIWGMGGSGKTTLARQVFRQDEVKRHFDCLAWVCISQQCNSREVWEEILLQLTSPTEKRRKEIASMRQYEIAEELCRIQRGKRCLVIIDDIWNQEAWFSLKAGFPVNEETESRILLTTRNKEVAMLVSRNDFLLQPLRLDEKQSLELFEKIALSGSGHTDYEKKKDIGKKMLLHCSGLPLAISVLAGLLSRRETIVEWDAVLRNADVYIMRGTNALEREDTDQEYYGVRRVLALSYDDLPSQLKLCFLYLAQFPEDSEILVKRLTQLLIAEGFITSEMQGSVEMMEDVAYFCLIELVERSMVQVGKYGSTGKVKSCRLHDLMRDLCLQKAKEEKFLEIVNFTSDWPASTSTALIGKVRRRVIYLDRNANYESSSCMDGRDSSIIRSLLNFVPEGYTSDQVAGFEPKWNKKVMQSVFNNFKLLRVLKFEHIWTEFELPKTIGDLVHLRFLSLRRCLFRELPSSLSNLVLLQTLDLRSSTQVRIKNVFWNMEKLRHLYLPGWHTLSGRKLSLARLHNLQTLVHIGLKSCDLTDFVQLTNLKKLSIGGSKSHWETLKDLLISRSITYQHLRSLSLAVVSDDEEITLITRDFLTRCPHLYKLELHGKMTGLPIELRGYLNLTKVTLVGTELKGDQIQILEKVPNLRVLYLYGDCFEAETFIFSKGGFPQLQVLSLSCLEKLKDWKVESGAMPSLHRLEIQKCEKLRAVPAGLQDIATLKELVIDMMSSIFCDRVREGGEDFYKIKHVPSVILQNNESDEEDAQ